MRGRKRLPTVVKLLRGNRNGRPLNPNEPKPPALTTDCPDELTDPIARKEWERIIPAAIARGQITTDDRVMAIAHCELWATWLSQITAALQHPHIVASGPHKHPIPNPARCMANKTLLMLARVDAELGFSPASRSRVSVPGDTGDAFAKFG